MRAVTGKSWCVLLAAMVALGTWAAHAADPPAKEASGSGTMPKYTPTPEELQAAYQRAEQADRPGRGGRSSGSSITPVWFANNTRFWYRNDVRGVREFILVDTERGTRAPAFDHGKLAGALSRASGEKHAADRLPFDAIRFTDGGKAVQFTVGDTTWQCDLASYECAKSQAAPVRPPSKPGQEAAAPSDDEEVLARIESVFPDGLHPDGEEPQVPRKPGKPGADGPSPRSADGKWLAVIKDNNLFIRARENDEEIQLSQDGKPDSAYSLPQWSPDSKTVIAFRTEAGDRKEVYTIESSPKEGGRAKLNTRQYALPGDKFTAHELTLFDVAAKKQVKVDVDRIDFGRPRLRWRPDGRHFTYEKIDRGHQRFRLVEVDSQTGKARNLIDEKTDTFIWTAHGIGIYLSWLDKTDEIIYASERDGWRHLYLVDAKAGKITNQITKGDWVMRSVDRVDAAARQIWFYASGRNQGQDPYLLHYYRINFDGTGLVALTEGDGTHSIQHSPDRKHIIDTYSRVDRPPVSELRNTADGKLICKLEEADERALRANGWVPPEVFVAKGRDGKTDIWGIIARPPKLDPNKKYPVIEYIYAGPHDSHVPKTFSPARRFAALTELGFIVVQIDGMGTANRSKPFHDVCWHNLKDAGFPDRILWHQAVGQKYPYYDTSRVGIYGTSAGGQNSTGALLFHPDFYKAAVSACGCHDNRMDKASWNEQWMGYPVGKHYAESSNIDNAHRLRGQLLLIVGELDTNVPPESTLRLAGALITAGKDFDFLMVPGMGHSGGGTYGTRRLRDFFVRHLHGVEPPDRNAGPRRGG